MYVFKKDGFVYLYAIY